LPKREAELRRRFVDLLNRLPELVESALRGVHPVLLFVAMLLACVVASLAMELHLAAKLPPAMGGAGEPVMPSSGAP
jgi:hypothetical protein